MKFPKNTIALLLIIVVGYWLSTKLTTVSEIKEEGTQITITAEDINRILELNGASIIVHVETDSVFTRINTKQLFGFRIKLLEEEEQLQLKESRDWLIKAGVTKFELSNQAPISITLNNPEITSKEHLAEKYTVKKRLGIWNPVTMKQIEIQSRNNAVSTAIENGLLTEARFSVENALHGLLENVEIKWKETR